MSIYFKQADMLHGDTAFTHCVWVFHVGKCDPKLGTNIIFNVYARTVVCVTLCPEKEISVDAIAFIVLSIERVCVCVFVFI